MNPLATALLSAVVGITSGASTPDSIVRRVAKTLKSYAKEA